MPLGLVQGIANAFLTHSANKKLNNVWNQDPTYTANPLAGEQFGMAKNLFNARMFGAPQEERNIYGANANFNSQVNRNSADGSQALALAAAGQGQADQAFSNLQLKEQQNKYGLLNNLNNAYANMINEGDKVYSDKVRRFGDYAGIEGAKVQNRASAVNGIFNGFNSDFNDAMSVLGLATGMPGGLGKGSGGVNNGRQSGGAGGINWYQGWNPSKGTFKDW